MRGTRWLVEDRCEGTITEVARGEVEVEDFTVPPEPSPTPAPSPAPEGQPAPAAAPQAPTKDSGSKPRRVRIKRGQRSSPDPRASFNRVRRTLLAALLAALVLPAGASARVPSEWFGVVGDGPLVQRGASLDGE